MIYLLVGTESLRSARIKTIIEDRERIFLEGGSVSKEILHRFAAGANLFDQTPAVIVEGLIAENDTILDANTLTILRDSSTLFILREDKLLKAQETKYKKYATIERFEAKKEKPASSFNTFALADAFAQGDKVRTWVLYREAIERGTEPEALSGMLFWKIKQMILSSNQKNIEYLKHLSAALVSLYHQAHRGECDFTIGLEQFILESLSRKEML